MSRTFAAIALIVVIVIGGGIVATTAYQAGVSTAVTQAAADGATVVNPVVVPAYGWGWGPGFGNGFFALIGTLIILFIVFGLIRALIWGGRGRGGHWGGPGWDPEARRAHFESRFHGTFDDWHRQAHDAPTDPTTNAPPTTTPPTG